MWRTVLNRRSLSRLDRTELATARRDARWANHGRYGCSRDHRTLAAWSTQSACMVATLVVNQQAIAGLLDNNGLPVGRDWQRRRHTDQLRDLVTC